MKPTDDSNKDYTVDWLKSKEDFPKWLSKIFCSKEYELRMQALKRINSESMNVDVEKN